MAVQKVAAFKCKMNAFTMFIIGVFENFILTNVILVTINLFLLRFFFNIMDFFINRKTKKPFRQVWKSNKKRKKKCQKHNIKYIYTLLWQKLIVCKHICIKWYRPWSVTSCQWICERELWNKFFRFIISVVLFGTE